MLRKILMPVCIILVMVGAVTYLCAGHTEPERELIEKGPYFEVYKDGSFNYSYAVFDGYAGGQPVKTEGPLEWCPRITKIPDTHFVRIELSQNRNFLDAQSCYYDPDTGRFSETFTNVLDQYIDRYPYNQFFSYKHAVVAYATENRVVVCNIFDEDGEFSREISDFKYPLSKTGSAILEAHFIGDGQQIVISYCTGDDLDIVVEVFKTDI